MKAIQLIRVSTGAQDLDQQREAVIKRVLKDGYKEEDIISIEDKESATRLSEEERQGLNKLKSYIDNDSSINAVYIYELSRLSRNPSIIFSIRDYLQIKKVQLIVLKPEIKVFNEDWSINQDSSLIFNIFASFAETEGYNRKYRTKRGKLKARGEGKFLGGVPKYGYEVNPLTKKYVINPTEYKAIRLMVDLYIVGTNSLTSITKELKKQGFKTKKGLDFKFAQVSKILKDVDYNGEGIYPQIITKQEQNQINFYLDKKLNKTKHKLGKSLYYGQRKFYILNSVEREGNKRIEKLTPMSVKRSRASYFGSNGKQEYHISMNLVDSLLWSFCKEHRLRRLEDPEDIEEEKELTQDKINDLIGHIETLKDSTKEEERRIDFIEERLIMGRLSEDKANELENKSKKIIEENKALISQYESQIKSLKNYLDGLDTKQAEDKDFLMNLKDDVLRKQIIDEMIDKVVLIKRLKKNQYVLRIGLHHGIFFYFLLFTHKSRKEVYRYSENEDGTYISKPYDIDYEERFIRCDKK